MNRRLLSFAILALLAPIHSAAAQQTSYVLDRDRSLVWWQLDPNFGHLWATTCPNDPSWQPGEGHSAGYYINYKKRPKIKLTNVAAGIYPLFPRDTVRANCRTAVSGSFTTTDAKRFVLMKGNVVIQMDSITNGSDNRDSFAKKYVYSSGKYPTVQFTVDSLTNVAMSGDTINAVAVGTFLFRGVEKPTRVQVQGVKDPSGLRVRGLFAMPARELEDRYSVSKTVLSMGVGAKLWDTLFLGFDLILKQQ